MLQFLVDDYLGGYGLPQISTKSNVCSIILVDGVRRVKLGLYTKSEVDIVAVSFDNESWKTVILFSDRTEAWIADMISRSYVPADRFHIYLI